MNNSICIAFNTVILWLCRFARNGCPGLLAMLFLISMSAFALDPIDPEKPVYQPNWMVPDWAVNMHPGMEEKEYITPEKLADLEKKRFAIKNRQKMMDLGLKLLAVGLPMALIAFFASPMLKNYGFQMVSHFAFPTGLGLAASGAIFREWAQWYIVAPVAIALLVIYGVISCIRKDKGKEVHWPWKKKAPRKDSEDERKEPDSPETM